MTRLAEDKYITKYKVTKSISEAIKLFWEEHLIKEFSKY